MNIFCGSFIVFLFVWVWIAGWSIYVWGEYTSSAMVVGRTFMGFVGSQLIFWKAKPKDGSEFLVLGQPGNRAGTSVTKVMYHILRPPRLDIFLFSGSATFGHLLAVCVSLSSSVELNNTKLSVVRIKWKSTWIPTCLAPPQLSMSSAVPTCWETLHVSISFPETSGDSF